MIIRADPATLAVLAVGLVAACSDLVEVDGLATTQTVAADTVEGGDLGSIPAEL